MATIEEFCGKMENVESIGNLFMWKREIIYEWNLCKI